MNIRQITMLRCCEEQYRSAKCWQNSQTWLTHHRNGTASVDALRAAVREQMLACYYAEQARARLDRLNGVDAIVEQRA